MQPNIVNPDILSLVPINIELYYSPTELVLAHGTSFLYEYNSKLFLISNWHNFTGINPRTKEPLSKHGLQPDIIRLLLLEKGEILEKGNGISRGWLNFSVKIYDDDENLFPSWFIHPKHKEQVDVVALELEIPDSVVVYPINKVQFNDIKPKVADDIYILGFPYNLKGGGNLPIWKRGSIATEPDVDYELLPKMLVDTASREGMSGSPVIFRRTGIHNIFEGKLKEDSIIGMIQNFIGIYSGRILGKTEFEAQLGIIWKAFVIEEIIIGKTKDNIKNFA